MFDHVLRIGATFALMFFIVTLDSLPTWVVLFVAFVCVVAFIYEAIAVEEYLNDDPMPDTDTPIADKLAADLAFDRDFNKEL